MLKLTVKPGDYISIGENIRVIYSGGTKNNVHLLVEAPRELGVKRWSTMRKESPYFAEEGISPEAQKEIMKIIWRESEKRKER